MQSAAGQKRANVSRDTNPRTKKGRQSPACSGHRWASSWASCADPMADRQFDVQPVSATGGGWKEGGGSSDCSTLPQFLVSARFGAANMQIPCSFYFGSVFFSHTFRSSHCLLPPSPTQRRPSYPLLLFCFRCAMFSTHVASLFYFYCDVELIMHCTFYIFT